ncbi:hypothetical protein FBY35_2543 [Streptomyces sp. SLBN-118]|uniref:hypothetical protein n=1 Tax=Streptomyces sp. SLBN-118 TaxID=2768454 RepID=UPI001150A2EA|nr:hypothetical protein [Streptomyces sp. SLBN-118]TQK52117.1 hypothetical protein FBY35_2543 [Streptomyces sp. SLBN-118]
MTRRTTGILLAALVAAWWLVVPAARCALADDPVGGSGQGRITGAGAAAADLVLPIAIAAAAGAIAAYGYAKRRRRTATRTTPQGGQEGWGPPRQAHEEPQAGRGTDPTRRTSRWPGQGRRRRKDRRGTR